MQIQSPTLPDGGGMDEKFRRVDVSFSLGAALATASLPSRPQSPTPVVFCRPLGVVGTRCHGNQQHKQVVCFTSYSWALKDRRTNYSFGYPRSRCYSS